MEESISRPSCLSASAGLGVSGAICIRLALLRPSGPKGVGGLGKMFQLFGDQMEPLLSELNEVLAA